MNKNIFYAILGGIIILSSVIFFSSAQDILSPDANITNWYIGAAISALLGWILLFIGFIGMRK